MLPGTRQELQTDRRPALSYGNRQPAQKKSRQALAGARRLKVSSWLRRTRPDYGPVGGGQNQKAKPVAPSASKAAARRLNGIGSIIYGAQLPGR